MPASRVVASALSRTVSNTGVLDLRWFFVEVLTADNSPPLILLLKEDIGELSELLTPPLLSLYKFISLVF